LRCVQLYDEAVGRSRDDLRQLLERRPRTMRSARNQSPHPSRGLPEVAQLQIDGLLEGDSAEGTPHEFQYFIRVVLGDAAKPGEEGVPQCCFAEGAPLVDFARDATRSEDIPE
jgi:hypothetical protein